MDTLVIAGGSGGHLIPAMTLAKTLRAHGRCMILSSSRPADKLLSTGAGDWVLIDMKQVTPLKRWLRPSFAWGQTQAMQEVFSLVRRQRPDVVVGFGGYLSAVGIFAAWSKRIPTVIHEQNLLPGRANRWVFRMANAVAVSFPETKGYLNGSGKIQVTGNPIRPVLSRVLKQEARSHFGFDQERPVLLVMGGSQGSRAINSLSVAMWEHRTPAQRAQVQILHLAGVGGADEVQAAYRRLQMEVKVFPFLHEIYNALACATLAISRAGATAIAEMVACELPAVLIPYPHAGGHQTPNADWMRHIGGAVTLQEEGLTPNRLWGEVSGILEDPAELKQMRRALQARADTSALHRLESLVQQVAQGRQRA